MYKVICGWPKCRYCISNSNACHCLNGSTKTTSSDLFLVCLQMMDEQFKDPYMVQTAVEVAEMAQKVSRDYPGVQF